MSPPAPEVSQDWRKTNLKVVCCFLTRGGGLGLDLCLLVSSWLPLPCLEQAAWSRHQELEKSHRIGVDVTGLGGS